MRAWHRLADMLARRRPPAPTPPPPLPPVDRCTPSTWDAGQDYPTGAYPAYTLARMAGPADAS